MPKLLNKEDWDDINKYIEGRRNGSIPEPEYVVNQLVAKGQWTMISNKAIEYMVKNHSNISTFYTFLCMTAWTGPSDKDKHNIFNRYYCRRGLVASSWAQPTLAEIFDKSERQIIRWKDQLVEDGLIEVEYDTLYKGQLVYIVGEIVDGKYIKYFTPKDKNVTLTPDIDVQ